MQYWLICNQMAQAQAAVAGGVGRIFIDLELHGKQARQAGRDTLISHHQIADITPMRQALPATELMVRINPIHAASADEIEQVIAAGIDLLMLPMITDVAQVHEFLAMVAGRARTVLLLETRESAEQLAQIVELPGIDEVYIGLNDLHLSYGLNFMFEPLANGLVEQMVATIVAVGLPFGFGGVARVGEGTVPAELVLAEHLRLGSSRVILSRTFLSQAEDADSFAAFIEQEVTKLNQQVARLAERSVQQVGEDQQQFQQAVAAVVERMGQS